MKAISLTQPWASLVAVGAKRVETRSWPASYRGPLAIHAAKAMPASARDFALSQPAYTALHAAGLVPLTPLGHDELRRALPLGAVLAICNLVGVAICQPGGYLLSIGGNLARSFLELTREDEYFGDFVPGRFAWLLADIVALPEPIPAKGSLGLWDWTPPAGFPHQTERTDDGSQPCLPFR